ncbi:MAG: CPBP family glutamic-type intramembrane protease [Candidatus Promineifilaceae bacterium]
MRPLSLLGVDFDPKLLVIALLSTVVPMLDWYGHRLTPIKAYDRLIIYFVLPLAVILLLFRERPDAYGLRLGQWRIGLAWTLAACLLMAAVLWFVAHTPAMQRYYSAKAPAGNLYLIYITAVDLFGWEFMWRGFALFGLARLLGPGPAILIQAIPFAFMHLGKPELESFSTFFGGVAFGLIAWHSQSFLYPFLIHWFVSSFTQLVARP